jgi:hypothetical protein
MLMCSCTNAMLAVEHMVFRGPLSVSVLLELQKNVILHQRSVCRIKFQIHENKGGALLWTHPPPDVGTSVYRPSQYAISRKLQCPKLDARHRQACVRVFSPLV